VLVIKKNKKMLYLIVRADFIEYTKKKLSSEEISYGVKWINDYRNNYSTWEDSMTDDIDDFYDWVTEDSESIFIFDKNAMNNPNPLFGIKVFNEKGTLIEEMEISDVGVVNHKLDTWNEISATESIAASSVNDFRLCFVLNTDRFEADKLKIIQDKFFILPDSTYASVIVYDNEMVSLADNMDSFPNDSFDEMHPCRNLEFLRGFLICDNDKNYHLTYECGGLELFFEDKDGNISETKKSFNNCSQSDCIAILQKEDIASKDNENKHTFLEKYHWKIEKNVKLLSPKGLFPEIPRKFNYKREDILEYEEKNQIAYFEIQKDFLNGVFYDLELKFSSYAFILMFDVFTSFKNNKDIPALVNQSEILIKCCPTLSEYINREVMELVWPWVNDDSQKNELIKQFPGLDELLSIYDYAKFILHYDNHKIECLHIFDNSYVSISSVMLCKSKQKRFKVTNPQIAKTFCDVALFVLNKYDDFNIALEESLRLFFFKKKGKLSEREKNKIMMMRSRFADINWVYLLCFNRFIINVYKQLRIIDTRCHSDVKHPLDWGGFSITCFDEYLQESLEYYFGNIQ